MLASLFLNLTVLFDSFIENAGPFLVGYLFILCGDLNQINVHPLSFIGLKDRVNFRTRLEAQLDHMFVSDASVFTAQRHAPLSTSDRNIVLAIPKIYCKS